MKRSNASVAARMALGTLVALGATVVVHSALAQQQQPPPNGQRPTPPQEAFTACDGRRANDACTVQFQGRTIAGTCEAFTDARLFCRPEGMPAPPPNR